ncbi:MAG TPA: hypothetical protein VE621_11260, partial [Bryobacteraceae bacterium]|nr:hypothetical protein [Bryobacteraceae bacterium]
MLLSRAVARTEAAGLPWISVADGAPYFVASDGSSWTPIGQNDAITWPELAGLFRRRDLAPARAYFDTLAQHGVTCLRLMLEYSQTKHRYFERRAGEINKDLVRLWDDIFELCREYGLRVLLTPYDTYWMWVKWKHHPYNSAKGGPCGNRKQWLLSPEIRKLVKDRLEFASDRWGGDGAIFAWDLWNEIHPSHACEDVEPMFEFVADLSAHLRAFEQKRHGAAHPQTVSIFM